MQEPSCDQSVSVKAFEAIFRGGLSSLVKTTLIFKCSTVICIYSEFEGLKNSETLGFPVLRGGSSYIDHIRASEQQVRGYWF